MISRFFRNFSLFACLATFGAALLWAKPAVAQQTCREIFVKTKPQDYPDQLRWYRNLEIRNVSARTVTSMNKQTLQKLEDDVPVATSARASAAPLESLYALLAATKKHPVAAPSEAPKYQPEDLEIGYCFGRAMFVHLALLKMGVQKESIRKIWAVGPIKTPGGTFLWDFHVATIVYSRELGWVALDTTQPKPVPVRHWMSTFGDLGVDGRVRFYITDPAKFSVDLGSYDRVQMGLDLSKENDWYQHYFVDLMTSMREIPLEDLGLPTLPRDPNWKPVEKGANRASGEENRSTFGFFWGLFGRR